MQFIPIVERTTPEPLPVANEGWGESVRDRPLYVQEGDLVTDRSIAPRRIRPVPDRRVRRVEAPRHRRGLRADVRCRTRELVRGAVGAVRAFGDLRLALAIEHTGDLYSCDHFVEPAYKLGNIRRRA